MSLFVVASLLGAAVAGILQFALLSYVYTLRSFKRKLGATGLALLVNYLIACALVLAGNAPGVTGVDDALVALHTLGSASIWLLAVFGTGFSVAIAYVPRQRTP